jgi:hypothetical protein
VVVATPNWGIYGDTTPRNQQRMNPFHLDSIEKAHAEMVDVLKTRNIWCPWNPHMGGVQVATRWEVHVAPFGASRWNGVLGAHPRGWQGFFGHLHLRLQANVRCGPLQGWVCLEVDIHAWAETLGAKEHFGY